MEEITGMEVGKQDDQFIIILDIDKVFSAAELVLTQVAPVETDPTGAFAVKMTRGSTNSFAAQKVFATLLKLTLLPQQ